ncbi:LOW QUALITY PROTEIN: hypothetical protein ACG7TL_008046 [Trametes sanguinea]
MRLLVFIVYAAEPAGTPSFVAKQKNAVASVRSAPRYRAALLAAKDTTVTQFVPRFYYRTSRMISADDLACMPSLLSEL